jgi:hypothetical protein
MEKSLQILIKNTQTGCEQTYRNLVNCMNGLAGLNIINKDYVSAAKIYENVLKTEKEYENKIAIDNLQKIHALYNLNEVLITLKGESDRLILNEVYIKKLKVHLKPILFANDARFFFQAQNMSKQIHEDI